MKLVKEISIREFEPWGGAIDFYNRLNENEMNLLDDYLDEVSHCTLIDETALNDILWHEDKIIIETVLEEDYDEFYSR